MFGQNSGPGALDRWIGLDRRVKNCNFQGSEAQIGNAFNSKGLGIDFLVQRIQFLELQRNEDRI